MLFGLIAQRVFSPAGARVAAGWFALGFGVGLLSGRVPYDLGFAIGLGSVLALLRDRPGLALVLAVLTSLASPVAGAFLALAGVADALVGGGSWRRRRPAPDRARARTIRARRGRRRARAGARARRARPDRRARARLPRRRLGAVRALGLLAGARRACC